MAPRIHSAFLVTIPRYSLIPCPVREYPPHPVSILGVIDIYQRVKADTKYPQHETNPEHALGEGHCIRGIEYGCLIGDLLARRECLIPESRCNQAHQDGSQRLKGSFKDPVHAIHGAADLWRKDFRKYGAIRSRRRPGL